MKKEEIALNDKNTNPSATLNIKVEIYVLVQIYFGTHLLCMKQRKICQNAPRGILIENIHSSVPFRIKPLISFHHIKFTSYLFVILYNCTTTHGANNNN